MTTIFGVEREINGETVSDYAMLSHTKYCDLPRMLHNVGVDYCKLLGYALYDQEGGLTLPQLLKNAPPEMFKKYDITLTWLSEQVIPADPELKVVGKYEMDTYFNTVKVYSNRFRILYHNTKLIVNRLEKQRTGNHPVVSNWSAGKLATKALVWSHEFLGEKSRDLDLFFKKKLEKVTADAAGDDRAEKSVLSNPMPG